ncbi:hypothetical protein [Amycolatopsis nigrescens]|uniref:hypothetical protein n=1 Tax=Amycolatopsis nigrescens TaxID=381445 RepID=UPI00035D18A4|nr:hypothetical protein [Amycolatopsis nigrescens]
MGWQDELRRLDIELANGTITQHQHRKMRDELLAAASGGGTPSPVASPLQRKNENQPAKPAKSNWQSAAPVRPSPVQQAVAAQQAAPATERAEQAEPAKATSAAPKQTASAALLATSRPTTAPSPADERATERMPYPRLDGPTVVRPAVRPPAPPVRQQPLPSATTPLNFPPADDPAPSQRDRRKPTWLFLGLGVLLVLAMILGATWWLGSDRDENPGSSPSAAPPPAVSQDPPAAALEERLPALPGIANKDNSTVAISKGVELGLYPNASARTFTEHGASQVIYRASSDGPSAYFVLVIPTKSPDSAKAVVDSMRTLSLASGFTRSAGDQNTMTGAINDRRMDGTWYPSGEYAVNVWVSQPTKADKNALAPRLEQTLAAFRAVLPAA